jgi:hypothetical protein
MYFYSGPFRVIISLLIIFAIGGCASTNQPQPPQLTPGKVAIVPARFVPESNLNVYAKGKNAAAGELAGQGAIEGAAVGAVAPLAAGPYGIALYPFIAPFTILAGTVFGGSFGAAQGLMHGLPEQDARAVSAIVENALGRLYIQDQVATRVMEQARTSGYNVTYLPDPGPSTIEEQPEYQDLATDEYTAVLELAVTSVRFVAHKGDPPRLALEMKLRSRVVALSGSSISGIRDFDYKSRPHVVEKWSANQGRLMEEEFNNGYNKLSQYICEIYFPTVNNQ